MKIETLFTISASLLLATSALIILSQYRESCTQGKRLGFILASILTLIQWGIPAALVWTYGLDILRLVWNNPERVASIVIVSLTILSYLLVSVLLKKTFLPKGHLVFFKSLVPAFSKKQKQIIAFHEAGHLILHAACDSDSLPKYLEARITNGLRGIAGYVLSYPSSNTMQFPSQRYLTWECLMLLAGDLSTEMKSGNRFTGASSDLNAWSKTATRLLSHGLTTYPYPSGAQYADIRWLSTSKLLDDHRTAIGSFLLCNQKLIFQIANDLEFKGSLNTSQCRHYLSMAKGTELLPRITKDICPNPRKRKIRSH